ncbi:hypothetical protein HANVADRAFT_64008 [Hanseniaspora valbyensis NRRL Y-1626]|uniref:Uncharacterized protein n=1 Tax=Hanseniaspora valbyensis NRRL Y-1626 TaxID=766949 RepID=A0A1B7T853_9ASCO|nr:hypothetical protein HANVADRAFT_64008 [Hanseniaspora valbyensis NRRL Y-1626]
MNERQLDGNDQEEGEYEDEENENNNLKTNDQKNIDDDIDSDASSTYSNENKETFSNGKTLVKNKSNSSANVKFDENVTYVPYDSMESYAKAGAELTNLDVAKGGTAWGAGTIAGPTGERQPLEVELKIAEIQGSEFVKTVTKHFS